jgi:hypothetical protein
MAKTEGFHWVDTLESDPHSCLFRPDLTFVKGGESTTRRALSCQALSLGGPKYRISFGHCVQTSACFKFYLDMVLQKSSNPEASSSLRYLGHNQLPLIPTTPPGASSLRSVVCHNELRPLSIGGKSYFKNYLRMKLFLFPNGFSFTHLRKDIIHKKRIR